MSSLLSAASDDVVKCLTPTGSIAGGRKVQVLSHDRTPETSVAFLGKFTLSPISFSPLFLALPQNMLSLFRVFKHPVFTNLASYPCHYQVLVCFRPIRHHFYP